MQAVERFWTHVRPDGFCWEWTASTNSKGYGQFSAHGIKYPAHRFAYHTLVGEIPAGLTLDHLCRNTSCVNPDHLEPVTRSENSKRATRYMVEVCTNGHVYAENDNTLIFTKPNGRTQRRCRQCLLTREHARQGIACTYDVPCDSPTHRGRRKERHADGTCRFGHSMADAYVRGDGRGLMCRTCRHDQHIRKRERTTR